MLKGARVWHVLTTGRKFSRPLGTHVFNPVAWTYSDVRRSSPTTICVAAAEHHRTKLWPVLISGPDERGTQPPTVGGRVGLNGCLYTKNVSCERAPVSVLTASWT